MAIGTVINRLIQYSVHLRPKMHSDDVFTLNTQTGSYPNVNTDLNIKSQKTVTLNLQ